MEGFRESGSYYDVPADNIDLNVKECMSDGSYDPNRYMNKQRKMASESKKELSSQKYDQSRYVNGM